MTRSIAKLLRDTRGASLIEFALAAPFLGALVVGMVDVSQGYSAKVKLTQAAQRAIEKAMQGEKTTDLYDTLQQEGADAAGVATSAVTVKYWLECNGVNQNTSPSTMAADYDKTCTTGQTIARYVSIDIQKTYTPFFATRFLGSNSDGSFTLHGKAGVRVQ
jgi:Flp pilus assembly protein TadG